MEGFAVLLNIQLDHNRAMVGAKDIRADFSLFDFILQIIGHDKIVDTPPCVLLASLEAV